jgi:ferredoxin/nitrate reductase gamma subunit
MAPEMEASMVHDVDSRLLPKLRRYGAFDVSACFNCGNCTAVCPLAEESGTFPRRVIRMGQVGMESRLLADETLWMCYGCGECTRTCPRQADPAQYMAAARRYAISRYDPTGLSRLMLGSTVGQIAGLVLLSTLFTLLLLWHKGDLNGNRLALFDFIPGAWVHDIGVAMFAIIGIATVWGAASMVRRFFQDKKAQGQPVAFAAPALWKALGEAVMDTLAHRRHRMCDAEPSPERLPLYLRPWFVHAAIFGGFLAMLAATSLDFLLKPIGSPVPPWYPMRLLGAAGGLVSLYGVSIAVYRRAKGQAIPYDKSRFADWFFLVLLGVTVLTGLGTELVVYLPTPSVAAYVLFLVHVVLAMDLLALMPLTKFAHAIYRPLALALHRYPALAASAAAVATDH